MRLKEFFCLKNMFGVLISLALVVGCDNSNPVPTKSSPPSALSSPARLSAAGNSAIIVSDYSTGRVCFVDQLSLEPTQCFSIAGQPTGVLSYSGKVFIGNRSTRSVEVYNSSGSFLFYLEDQTGIFSDVNDLSIDKTSGTVYVLDAKALAIRAFNSVDGNEINTVVSANLARPTALTVDQQTGNLYVSDFGDPGGGILPRVRIFDSSGILIDEIVAVVSGGSLSSSQSFSTPQGLCIGFNSSGNKFLFIADAGASEIQVYDLLTKSSVKTIGVRGAADGELFYPLDVYVEPVTRDVYVADNRNGRVVVYPGEGEVP